MVIYNYMNKYSKALNTYPIMIIPIVQYPINTLNNFGFTTCFNIIIEGKDNVVTPIINERTVPSPTPLATKASAIGKVPNISAYIGTPIKVAIRTEYHYLFLI